MKLQGIVLAGGKSSRYGSDKALQVWEGVTLLERAVQLLDELGLDSAVIANADKDYSFLPCPVLNDLVPGQGPLEGLFTAYASIPEQDYLVLTCDMPKLTAPILRKLIDAYSQSGQAAPTARTSFTSVRTSAAMFAVGGRHQPFPGIYSSGLKERIGSCLASGDRSMMNLLHQIPDLLLMPPPSDPSVLSNINRPEELLGADQDC